ncbi:membrane protein implicated in regulation of membrane protease activity [Corynebacterium mustelae]|uniref:Membrane protein implicated in regulation of membrane protease activity n=1 Tax=Corynebacterium mustelae TaxID=571915 RepID=A0A0G3GXS5_9CORY|nr:NfeD family protein [Corynebacterium mustelae]AKK05974.1 membrane protein implicated in regulation of membrane protease activity [Corynebacterium mustelae]
MGVLIWLIAGLLLIGTELLVGELTLLMLGLAAVGTAGVAAFGIPLGAEVAVFAVLSLSFLFFLKPMLKRHMVKEPVLDTSVKALEGSTGVVLETVSGDTGQIRLDGSIWSARSLDPNHSFTEGERVSVVSIDGSTAIIWKEI